MNREQVWRDFEALPPHAQQQVADFIAFLRARTNETSSRVPRSANHLADEPFIGMWQDRDDLSDSSAWVRQLRREEWTP